MTNTIDDQLRRWKIAYESPELNVAHALCDSRDPSAVAFTLIDADLQGRDVTFGMLGDQSRRFATVLAEQGVRSGDRVGVLMGKRTELLVALMAIWRLGAVYVPLFTAFAPAAIQSRLERSQARVILTEPTQVDKVKGLAVTRVLTCGPGLNADIQAAAPLKDSVAVGGSGEVIRIFTSGTTGEPKAVSVPAASFASFASYLHFGLDVRDDDVYWNAADPGWAYGLYYAIVAPLVLGRTSLLLDAGFSAELTAGLIHAFGVTNLAAAPTVYRSLAASGKELPRGLRAASSAGEPLTADVVSWSRDALGVEVRDHFGQTEHGMVVVNAWNPDVARPTRPGTMGRALPGFSVKVINGRLALDVRNSPLMWFRGYVDAPEATASRFDAAGTHYFTGDLCRMDDEGYTYFASREDDMILMAGYRISPNDIENVISKHPSIAEVAVVGRPDEIRGEVVEAFVVLTPGSQLSDDLVRELQNMVRSGYGAHAYPRRVHAIDAMPKTPSAKIQRNVLRTGSSTAK